MKCIEVQRGENRTANWGALAESDKQIKDVESQCERREKNAAKSYFKR